jgi:hypothetical protein
MKSKIVKVESKKVLNFPKLMILTDMSRIVLFSQEGIGLVVWDKCFKKTIGDYSNNWAMRVFRDFEGTVKLSNE